MAFFCSEILHASNKPVQTVDTIIRSGKITDVNSAFAIIKMNNPAYVGSQEILSSFFNELYPSRKTKVLQNKQTNEVIGFLSYCVHDCKVAEIVAMHIVPQSQSLGYGKKFLQKRLDNFSQKEGVDSVILAVEKNNIRAKRFYEKCGFVTIPSQHPHFYDMKISLSEKL
jgi:ribosomal protein S18 acetylase RimI-like enzyme